MRHTTIRNLILGAILAASASGCTYATMTLKDGTRVSYFDFHPGGNAVNAKGIWETVGSFEIDRTTADSSEVAGAIAEGVVEAVLP